MSFNRLRLHNHLKNSVWVEHLHTFAGDVGFLTLNENQKENYLTGALYALEVSKIENLCEVDDFIHKNFEKIQQFLIQIKDTGIGESYITASSLYELMILLKEPSIFSEAYISDNNWNETIADFVKLALDFHAPLMTEIEPRAEQPHNT